MPDIPKNVTPVASLSVCKGFSALLKVSAVGTAGWYAAATGGQYLGGGLQFATPPLSATTTFYVQDSTCQASPTRKAITVTVFQQPVTAISGNLKFCPGKSTLLTATGSFPDYEWSNGKMTDTTTVSTIGVYSVTVTDANTCTATVTAQVSLHPAVVASIKTPSAISCPSPQVTLNAPLSSTGSSVSYQWTTQGGNLVSGGNGLMPVVDKAGLYFLFAQDEQTNCSGRDTVQVTGNTIPPNTVGVKIGDISCAGKADGEIVVAPVTGGASPFWYSLDGGPWQASNVFGGLKSGSYDISTIGANECQKVVEATILPRDSLRLEVLLDSTRLTDTSGVIFGKVSNEQGSLTWLWDWSHEGLSCTDCPEPVIQSQISDYVYCTITDAKGCVATDKAYVLDTYTPPNKVVPPDDVIVPGPDGELPAIVFPDLEKDPLRFADNEVVFFNRWGQEVYSAKPYDNEWKGTFKTLSPHRAAQHSHPLRSGSGNLEILHPALRRHHWHRRYRGRQRKRHLGRRAAL